MAADKQATADYVIEDSAGRQMSLPAEYIQAVGETALMAAQLVIDRFRELNFDAAPSTYPTCLIELGALLLIDQWSRQLGESYPADLPKPAEAQAIYLERLADHPNGVEGEVVPPLTRAVLTVGLKKIMWQSTEQPFRRFVLDDGEVPVEMIAEILWNARHQLGEEQ